MRLKNLLPVILFLLLAPGVNAQINSYIGGSIQGLYSVVREEGSSFKPGFGAGLNFYYWEYTYWFFKAGIDYNYRSSLLNDYPSVFGEAYEDYPDRVEADYTQHDVSIPLSVYFPVTERRGNSVLLVGTLEMAYAIMGKMSNSEFGDVQLKASYFRNNIRTSVGIGAGYQRQLDNNIYLNAFPSFNLDLRADRPFNTIKLTVEIMYGIY